MQRLALLPYERFLRSSGVLYGIAGVAFALSVVGALIDGRSRVEPWAALAVAAIGGSLLGLGVALARLDPRARLPAPVLAVLGLAALGSFPIRAVLGAGVPAPVVAMSSGGALFHVLLLGVLLGRGRRILSPSYRGVLETTRSIKPGPSMIVWGIAGLTVAAAVIV